MPKLLFCALLLAGTAITSGAALADGVYRWTDKAGKVHFSDMPPPPDAQKVEQRMMRGNQIATDKLPYAVRKAAEAFPVTLFVADKCPACPSAQQYLKARGIPYSESRVTSNEEISTAAKLLGDTDKISLPSLLVGGQPYKGYSESEWASALDAAGYPAKKKPAP